MNTEVHADVKLVVVFLRSFKHAKILFAFECELHLLGKHFVLISNQIFTTEYPLIKLWESFQPAAPCMGTFSLIASESWSSSAWLRKNLYNHKDSSVSKLNHQVSLKWPEK